MNEFTIAILLVALLGASAQDSTLEDKAVTRVQQTPASRYDSTLPSSPFGNWLNKVVGPQSGVSWRLGECVDRNGTASGWEQGVPACVEATAILPDDRKIVAQIHVGTFKQGLSGTTRFHFAVIESDSQFLSIRKLSDLPQLLRDPLSVKSPDEGKRPKIVTLPQIRLNLAPQLYYAKSPVILSPPMISPGPDESAPPPPKPEPPVRVSKGVSGGDVLSRTQAVYPSIARQVNASGEVIVSVTINEEGRVISARAVKGHSLLRRAAEEAAKKWVFKPTLLDGKPVRQTGNLTFIFTPPR
ncbi:MAG TPA: energy transducer TonB [Blastocatellia bacterium]|jgi:TonB family protein|nr:energy transducer TonB [Blastocatellia bacterium]